MSEDIGKQSESPREWFGQALVKLADPKKPNFYVASCDLAGGTGVYLFREAYPDRHLEIGIAEQSAMGICAGFADGLKVPVILSGFATFLSRGWEIARLQIFYNNIPVIIAMSHLGLDVGPDSVSGASYSYYSLWRSIPGDHVVAHPGCPLEMEAALRWMLGSGKPGVLFTGRSPVKLGAWADKPILRKFQPGKFTQVYKGRDVNVLASGHVVARCVEAAKKLRTGSQIKATVWSVPCLKPLGVSKILTQGLPVITVEDHGPAGGLFEAVAGEAARAGISVRIAPVCVDGWGQSGGADELADHYGIGVMGIMEAVKEALRNE